MKKARQIVLTLVLISFWFEGGESRVFGESNKNPGQNSLAQLGWRNGDTLKGRILPSSGGRLTWKSDAFMDSFVLDQRQLKSIEFPESYLGSGSVNESPFRITFLNGDRLYGDLIEINAETVKFRSPRLSRPIVVKRSFLNRIERISGSHLRYSGPTELERWKPLGRNAKDADWYQRKTGEFATHRWGAELFREIGLPEKVEISFCLESPYGAPNVEIGISEDSESGPKIETWDDTMVLSWGTRFEPILSLSEETSKLDFRIFWNRERQFIKVCNADGQKLCELRDVEFDADLKKQGEPGQKMAKSPEQKKPGRIGFRLLNRTPGVIFSRLSVREWDGKTIPRFDASQPRIEMTGGQILFELDDLVLNSSKRMKVRNRLLPFENVDQLVFSTARHDQEVSTQSRLTWHDGGIISGPFLSIDDKSVNIQPEWFEQGISVELTNAKELYFPESVDPVMPAIDTIQSGDLKLGGVLTPGYNGSPHTLLSWKPIGSENASPLAENREADITREAYPGATELVGDARIYLINDEVIAGKLVSIDETHVEFISYLTGQVKIPTEKVRAVDIEGAGLIPNGFVDKGWMVLPSEEETPAQKPADGEKKNSDVILNKETVLMKKGGFGHLNLLVGDRIRFHSRWKTNYGIFTIRLFCSDFSKDSPSTDILIGAQSNRILVGQLKPGGGFSFSGDQVTMKDQKADIEILAHHDKVEVSVNGKKSLTLDVKPEQISGNGIVFQMGGGWRGWNENSNEIEFSNFSIDRSPGFLPKRIINAEAKEHALTIPRFHRDDPPSHVLVAANGDLLRGKLKSAHGPTVKFMSRGKEMNLSRSRVSAVVWLREKPETIKLEDNQGEKESTPSETDKKESEADSFMVTHQFVLHDGTRLNLAAESIEQEEEIFTGKSEILGRCKIPIHSMRHYTQAPAHPLARTASSDQSAYSDWFVKLTPDPAIPKGDGSDDSPLIGKVAPDFTLPLLKGGEFSLADRKGRVVVLDFWATWCGPCIKAMPEIFRALNVFNGQPVDFCAVNQAETAPIITQFLENRSWTDTTVGLDFQLNVGRDYSVKGIPHTVVIGRDGKIAWVHTGYSPDLSKKLVTAISRALQKK